MVNWEAPKPVGIVVPVCNASGPKEPWYDEDQIVERDRNVDAFDRGASEYERGYLADWHRIVVARSVDVALAARPTARRVLDVGCGTGALLRLVAARLPAADRLDGVDAAAGMVAAGNAIPGLDPRIRLQVGRAEQLPLQYVRPGVIVEVETESECCLCPERLPKRPARPCAATLRGPGHPGSSPAPASPANPCVMA